jgi:hypothetical protein
MESVRMLTPQGGAWTEDELRSRALSPPELLARSIDIVGLSATSWAVEVAARATEQIRGLERTGGFPTASSGHVRRASEVAFLQLLIAVTADPGDEVYRILSDDLLEIVRLGVRRGLPLDVLLNRVWGIHTVTRDEMIAELQRILPEEERASILRELGAAMLDYANSHAYRVAMAYAEEQRAWRGWRTETQRRTIAAVVDGSSPPDRDGGPLDVHWPGGHLYALSWFEEQSGTPDVEQSISEFADSVGELIGAERVVVIDYEGTTQLWWSAPGALAPDAASLIRSARRPDWMRLAVGPQGRTVEGFRAAVRGARLTERMARLPEAAGGSVWRFDEVGHLALLVENRDAAAWYVRQELAALAGPGTRLAEIRDTVRRYLESGNSRVLVAKELHLAPNTVAYRVGKASELLGRPVAERSQQVLLALQLVHTLPGLIDPPRA